MVSVPSSAGTRRSQGHSTIGMGLGEQTFAAYRERRSIRVVAAACGTSYGSAYRVLRLAGANTHDRRSITGEKAQRVVAMHQSGLSVHAARVGHSHGAVLAALRSQESIPPPRPRPSRRAGAVSS